MILNEVLIQETYHHAKANGMIYFAKKPNLKAMIFITEPKIIYGKIICAEPAKIKFMIRERLMFGPSSSMQIL